MPTTETKWIDAEHAALAARTFVEHVDAFKPEGDHAKEQQQLFFAGEIRNPNFSYPQLAPVGETEALIEELNVTLATWQDNSPLGQLYRALFEERRAMQLMCAGAVLRDSSQFHAGNELLWGAPRPDVCASIVADLRQRAQKTIEKNDKAVDEARALITALQSFDEGPILLPNKDQFAESQHLLLGILEDLHIPDGYPTEGHWEGPMMAEVLTKMFAAAGANLWRVVLVDDQQRLSVHRDLREVRMPRGRKLTAARARETCGHEGLHVYRALKGEQTGYYILYMGTAYYIYAEEGSTTALTQAMKGSITRHASEELYMAQCLAYGVDGTQRDFRDVYEWLVAYFRFSSAKASAATKSAESPEQRAWTVALRTFRGTTCDVPGVYYGFGRAYAEGNLAVWNLLINQPERVPYFSIGKFSPFWDFDVDNLVTAGVIPKL